MKVLIIEDNKLKAENIKKCVLQHFEGASIEVATAYSTGVRKAYVGNYDFIIIDNSLPYYNDHLNDIRPDMAALILENLEDEIDGKCIICSAYERGEKEDYFSRLVEGYGICIGYVRYDPCEDDWKNQTIRLIKEREWIKKQKNNK